MKLPKVSVLIAGLLAVFLVSLPASQELFKPGYYSNHDGEGHIIRFEEFNRALEDGHFPPRLSKNLMYGYGFYFFNFNYPLVHWLGQGFHEIGYDFTDSVKAVSYFGIIASGITMFLWQRNKWGFWGGLTAAIFYMYAPYRLMNVYVRGSLAEHLAFVSIPLVFMFVEKIAHDDGKRRLQYTLLGGISYAIMLLSHNIMAFIFSIMMGLFILYQVAVTRKIIVLKNYILMGVSGLLLTAFFWFPSLYEKKFVRLDQTIGKDFPDHFVYIQQLWERTWGYGGSGPGLNDGLSLQVGTYHLLAVLVAVGVVLLLLAKKKASQASYITFFIGMFILSVFFMLEVSKPLWEHVPLFAFTQFPWRYLSWSIFVSSVLAGSAVYGVKDISKDSRVVAGFVAVIVGLLIFSSRTYWLPNLPVDIQPIGDRPIPGSTTWADEQFPVWMEPKPNAVPEYRVETYPQTDVAIDQWKTAYHAYELVITEPTKVVENTAYYPGWRVWANGAEQQINYEDSEYPGRLVFTLQPGTYLVETRFTETLFRQTMNLISLISAVTISVLLGKTLLRK